ncbi:MAG: hypothetical protein K6E59_07055 [Bacilli bacterium]|nr:hypothetical protein [Bacilli bacterium]
MQLKIDVAANPSPCQLNFYDDGSFGQGEPWFFLDYEINLSFTGSLELLASKESGICYCLEGFSWKNYLKARQGEIDLGSVEEGQLLVIFGPEDPTEWGTGYGKEFGLAFVDLKQKLALYGAKPSGAEIIRFAQGQFVCQLRDEVVGFIVDFSAAFVSEQSQ